MAGIIGIYGLVVSVLVSSGLKQQLPLYTGFIQLGAGLSVGLAGLAAGTTPLPHLFGFDSLTIRQASRSASWAMPESAAQPSSRGSSSA